MSTARLEDIGGVVDISRCSVVLEQEVKFVGDSVAAVAAEDWNIAEETARRIRVEYEILPAVYDPEIAAQANAPIAVLNLPEADMGKPWWEDHGTPTYIDNTTNVYGPARGQPSVVYQRGDVEKALRGSDCIVERVFRHPMVSGVAHEPRACVALYEEGRCTLWCSVQEPYKRTQDCIPTGHLDPETASHGCRYDAHSLRWQP